MYSLKIPEELVHQLYLLRESRGISIRAQILNACWAHVYESAENPAEVV